MDVYSFENTKVVINHPNFGRYEAYGSGLGDISVDYAQDVTSHDVSTDLSVVVSKHAYKHGTVTFNILQATDFNKWITAFSNYLENATTEDFALATITIGNINTGDGIICTGCSHQKKPTNSYQASAQTRSWVFMAANITTNNPTYNKGNRTIRR